MIPLTGVIFFIHNLLPVTIGNVIGGAGLVGLVYWFVFLRKRSPETVLKKIEVARKDQFVLKPDADLQFLKKKK